MLSFVVQNFYHTKTSLTRTKKYNQLAQAFCVHLLFLFLKNNIHLLFYKQGFWSITNHVMYFYRKQLIRPFWKVFMGLHNPRMGLYSNNISKSLTYYTTRALTRLVEGRTHTCTTLPSPDSRSMLAYSNPVITVSLALQRSLYSTTVLYFMHFLPCNYVSTRTYFKPHHGFIITPSSFNLYMFCNFFYFKLRHH